MLRGGDELRKRLAAIPRSFRTINERWAEEDVRQLRSMTPVRTGKTARSYRVAYSRREGAAVRGAVSAKFIDRGTRPHDIEPKNKSTLAFQGKRGTIFARKVHHRGMRKRPFIRKAGMEAYRRQKPADTVVQAWNDAA